MHDIDELLNSILLPLRRASQLTKLDSANVQEGCRDGSLGKPEPDDHPSFYWNGWRNGVGDGGDLK